MNIIFFGTSRFAVPILESLFKSGKSPIAVVTNPDKPAGRKNELTPGPVKLWALERRIKIYQPDKLKDSYEDFKKLNPELCIVAAYGKLIPKEYLETPKHGFLNTHPSLLPKYRGPTPIQTVILNGEKETGVTIMLMDEEMDHGPVLKTRKLEVGNKNYEKLEKELSILGAELLIETLPQWISGKIEPVSQDHSKATRTKKFTWPDGKIDWSESAQKIHRQILALNPEPGTHSEWKNKTIKILKGYAVEEKTKTPDQPGRVILIGNQVLVKCGQGFLLLEEVQLEGRKLTGIIDFLRGHQDFVGSVLF